MKIDPEDGFLTISTWAELKTLDHDMQREWIADHPAEYKAMAAAEMAKNHFPKIGGAR